jgi:hypothetical protein
LNKSEMTWHEKPTEATSLQSLQVETECPANHSLHVITCHVIHVYHVTLNYEKIYKPFQLFVL